MIYCKLLIKKNYICTLSPAIQNVYKLYARYFKQLLL